MRTALTVALTLALGLMSAPMQAQSLEQATLRLDLQSCEESSLLCVTLPMPLDHRANDPSNTIDITFALSYADVESRGILFFFVGGPGASGLASAENYLSSFDESLTDYMDIVFVDQRGTGPDHGLSCPDAQARFDAAPLSLNDPEGAKAAARAYVADCIAQLDRAELLPFVASDQAIRDSEAFRKLIGAPKVWLYGESYGTQFVQGYAATYPSAVKGVVLDGVVDLSLDAPQFYTAYTIAAEEILTRTLAACMDIAPCARDMGRDATAVYDDLAARLQAGPVEVPFPRADGTVEPRQLTSGFLESSAFYALYAPEGRAEFLRALAAAERGNLLPMLHLGYVNAYIDPETLEGVDDPGWFGAAFYAITCTDYDSGSGTPDERADRILAKARDHAPNAPRLLRSFFQEQLACAYWPHQGPAERPARYAGGDWPTLILNADADPITPAGMAYDLLDNARNAYGVIMAGGPHVIWGRGFDCPDKIVQALMFDGSLPVAREQLCEQDLIAPYVPLTLTDPAQLADPLAVARAVEDELYQLIPLTVWDGYDPLTIGCDFGGSLTVSATTDGTSYRLSDCRLWPDLAISGTGTEVNAGRDDDGLTLQLRAEGAQGGDIAYLHRWNDEAISLSGQWNGQPATLPRRLP
jgi:pimeloyl-ACP methyl ester carboxylesterase